MFDPKNIKMKIGDIELEGCGPDVFEKRDGGGTIRFTVEADLTDDGMIKLLKELECPTMSLEDSDHHMKSKKSS